jgi:hypothetical protein
MTNILQMQCLRADGYLRGKLFFDGASGAKKNPLPFQGEDFVGEDSVRKPEPLSDCGWAQPSPC